MASGRPFLTLQTVPPLGLAQADDTNDLQVAHHDDSNVSPIVIESLSAAHDKTQSLVPAPNLRKSVSVDSLAQYNRESPVSSGPRPNRGDTGSALEPPRNIVNGHSSSEKKEWEEQLQTIRTQGENNRSDALGSPVERYRHTSLKPQDLAKPVLRGGELPLPSRTPTLSTASSLSSVVSDITTNSSTLQDAPRSLSSTSLQLPRRGTLPPIAVPGRARSGSLEAYGSKPVKRPTTSSYIYDIRNVDPTVTLVVVGTPGCGKSTVIRKGLKKFALSEAIACRSISGIPGIMSVTNYIRRTGRVGQLENIIDCPLKVVEANIILPTAQGSLPRQNVPILDPVSRVDGVVVCYDASSPSSFLTVENLLSDYSSMRIPTLVLACKSDLTHWVDSAKAHSLCKQYDVGLIEVNQDAGKDRIGLAFEFLMQAVWRDRRDRRQGSDVRYRNPASPRLLRHSSLWHTSHSTTTSPSPLMTVNTVLSDQKLGVASASNSQDVPSVSPPTVSISLKDSGSPGDARVVNWERGHGLPSMKPQLANADNLEGHTPSIVKGVTNILGDKDDVKEKDLKPTLFMTAEELLDKLLFLAVSADDPAFITHFLLTYRRFATPRTVLLAMQKRMRQLDSPSGDPMFACFAQMRICALLEAWIKDYPHDFAVSGTAGALSALIKSILSKTYLLHYASELLPFLETLPALKDVDAAWALKVDNVGSDSDCESSMDEEVFKPLEIESVGSNAHTLPSQEYIQSSPLRERKASLPLAKALKQVAGSVVNGHGLESAEASTKQKLKDLVKLAHEVMLLDADAIAQEITRLHTRIFLGILPRHWLHLTFVGKNEASESITALISFSNHLAEWVVSLILCHDKPRNRARQIEKFVEIATKLRHLNNYSALRAFIAGINGSAYPEDETMETFRTKSPEHYKSLQSWELLFRPLRSHRAYRMALRNSKGGCIPALEVHIQDLIRAHEGNSDTHAHNVSKIHWGKFNLFGKFIISTTQCQIQCRSAGDYHFPDRSDSIERLFRQPLMSEELRRIRLPPEYVATEDVTPSRPGPQQAPPPKFLPRPSRSSIAQPKPPRPHPPKVTVPQTTSQENTVLLAVPRHTNSGGPIVQAKLPPLQPHENDLLTMHKLLYW
ncbi:hypothetical protein APHAL10511_006361 [Amanita phalloides]|nr:hypothetical protein APHAL10511_006361 [Amanita phalloides]